MLPDPDHLPTGRLQLGVHSPIALDVPVQLPLPKIAISTWIGTVLRTTMPEATIDESGNHRPRKCDIDSHSQILQIHPVVLSESESALVQSRAKSKLRRRVAASVGLHRTAGGIARSPGANGATSHRLDPTPPFMDHLAQKVCLVGWPREAFQGAEAMPICIILHLGSGPRIRPPRRTQNAQRRNRKLRNALPRRRNPSLPLAGVGRRKSHHAGPPRAPGLRMRMWGWLERARSANRAGERHRAAAGRCLATPRAIPHH